MEDSSVHTISLLIETIAMPASVGLVVGLIVKRVFWILGILAAIGVVMVATLVVAGGTRVDGGSVELAKASMPLLTSLGEAAWRTAISSPPSVMGACIGAALRMWFDSARRIGA